jgi:hypothetical protein
MGNTKHPLEDAFAGVKTMVTSEREGGAKPGKNFEFVAMLEHFRTHPRWGPDKPMASVSLSKEDWDPPFRLPPGLRLKDIGDRFYDPPSFRCRATECRAVGVSQAFDVSDRRAIQCTGPNTPPTYMSNHTNTSTIKESG